MKTAILYCSYSGNTKALAVKKAAESGADIEGVMDVKKPSMFSGIFKARKRAKSEIRPIKLQLGDYEKIIIMSPVWAAHPVPAINSLIECLPKGVKVEFIMVSAGGGTKKSSEGTKELVTTRGCEVVGYTDVKVKRKNNEVFCLEIK